MRAPAVLPSAVLFACTLNAIRSPMAAGLMRVFHGRRIYIESCGVKAGEPDGFAIAVMEELGIDIAGYRPKTFAELKDDSFDLIISLSPEAHHHALEMTRTLSCEVEYWPTLEPTAVSGNREQRLDAYRAVRDTLRHRLDARFPPQPGGSFASA